MCILAGSPEELQRRLDAVTATARRLSLTFNADKCTTLHFSGLSPVGCRNTSFSVENHEIPNLSDFDQTTFVGKEFGYKILSNWAKLADFMKTGETLLNSSLAPWQRLDAAVKTFLYPATQFALRAGSLNKTDWQKLDEYLKPLIKRTLNLPTPASNDYLYGERKKGCIGIPVSAEDCDVVTIDGAFKVLTSPDLAIRLENHSRRQARTPTNCKSPRGLSRSLPRRRPANYN